MIATSAGKNSEFRTLPLAEMKAIVSRFDNRVLSAQWASPPTKHRVRKALRRHGSEQCPAWLRRLSTDVIVRYGDDLAELYCRFPDDVIRVHPYEQTVGYQPPERKDRIDDVQAMMQAAEWTDEWGTRWAHAFGGVGATAVDHPIKEWSELDDYLAHRMPDPHAPGRLERARALLADHGERRYCMGMLPLALFERFHCLRGMENTFYDFCEHEAEVARLSEALTEYLVQLIRDFCQTSISAVCLTDDWGSQQGLLISPAMWRKFFGAHYRRIFAEIHRWDKDVIFHSCGNVMQILPDLIEAGIDVVDPVQPMAMDLNDVARSFGRKVAFSGGINDQRLETATPQQVRNEVEHALATLGKPFGNAYLVGPANVITPTVPFENIQALVEACHNG